MRAAGAGGFFSNWGSGSGCGTATSCWEKNSGRSRLWTLWVIFGFEFLNWFPQFGKNVAEWGTRISGIGCV